MKNTIPPFLQDKLKSKGFPHTSKFPNNIKDFMISYSKFYNWNIMDLKRIYKLMKENISILPTCKYEKCNNDCMITVRGISDCCSHNHSVKFSNMTKYGVENVFQLESTKIKSRKTIQLNFGVDYNMQRTDCKEKAVNTCIKKYGFTNISQLPITKEKIKKTCLIHYGVDNPSKVMNIRKKAEQTMLNKYGFINPSTNNKIKEKKKETTMRNYGVEYPAQSEVVMEKITKTNMEKFGVSTPLLQSGINTYKRKEYKWETGEISLVQGYEPIVLKELEEQGYKFDEILTSPKDMPKIMYQLDTKERRYYPDIFIPKDNIIIEVKSDYTLNKEWDKNQAKFKATKSLGFDFRLEVR